MESWKGNPLLQQGHIHNTQDCILPIIVPWLHGFMLDNPTTSSQAAGSVAGGSVGWKGNSPSISRSLPSSGRETHPKNKESSFFAGAKKKILFEWNKGRITWVIFDVARFQLPFEVESIFKKLRDETFPLTMVEFENVDVKGNLESLNLDIITALSPSFWRNFGISFGSCPSSQ